MNETLEMLGIQWQKLLVQGIDFGVALFVLWKFAYQPIFNILDARKAKIADGLDNADKIKAELAKTEAARQHILNQATDLANQMIEQAREAAAQDHAKMLAELKREVGRLVVQTTTTVTGKILTADDQKRLAEETQKQLA